MKADLPSLSDSDFSSCRTLLREVTQRAVTAALSRQRRLTDEVDAVASEVQPLIHRACEAARQEGLYAEQLLILLKSEWRAMSAARQLARCDGEGLLSRVVNLCIREYFASTRSEGRRAD